MGEMSCTDRSPRKGSVLKKSFAVLKLTFMATSMGYTSDDWDIEAVSEPELPWQPLTANRLPLFQPLVNSPLPLFHFLPAVVL
jgi:hypothetical protein